MANPLFLCADNSNEYPCSTLTDKDEKLLCSSPHLMIMVRNFLAFSIESRTSENGVFATKLGKLRGN